MKLTPIKKVMVKSPLVWISLLLINFSGLQAQDSLDIRSLGRLGYTLTINDVWGWVDTVNNKEYALVGVQNGLSVVDVTNPSNPIQTNFFAGASSTWRDMKTYGNYAYTVHDNYNGTSNGIFIVDMTTITNTFPVTYTRKPSITVAGNSFTLDRAHNLYIDEAAGLLFLFGADVSNGGALIFDIATDPTNPSLLGVFDDYYLHDGVARGDTLWGAAVLDGFFIPIDISTKSNPTLYTTQTTPYNFTHNIWFSDDNQRVWTTDEKSGAFIAEYDVSDFNNITELDRIRTSFGTDVIPHNAHFYNNFLVNSYYTSGVQILDVSQDGLMVETGYYDTSLDSGDGFSGCWGAYPYLPSGNILATDRQRGLFVLQSDYSRGCYLYLTVIDSLSRQNLINANITVLNGDISGRTNIFGNFRDAQAADGSFQMVVSKTGYRNDTLTINLSKGVSYTKQVALLPANFSLEAMGPLRDVELYPNPQAADKVVLQFGNWRSEFDGLNYHLHELNGRLLKAGELFDGELDLRALNLAAGTYFLQVEDPNFSRTYRLILQ